MLSCMHCKESDTCFLHHALALLNQLSGSGVQCKEKPKGDKYGFTYFARMMNNGKGLAPLPSDSRRRPDRAALEVCCLHV